MSTIVDISDKRARTLRQGSSDRSVLAREAQPNTFSDEPGSRTKGQVVLGAVGSGSGAGHTGVSAISELEENDSHALLNRSAGP